MEIRYLSSSLQPLSQLLYAAAIWLSPSGELCLVPRWCIGFGGVQLDPRSGVTEFLQHEAAKYH